MEKLNVRLTSSNPMLMHSDALVDPLHPALIEKAELTGKRKKTADDHKKIAEIEYIHSIYLDEKGEITLPNANIKATLINGAKLNKLGSTIKRAVLIPGLYSKFDFGYKKATPKKLWEGGKHLDVRPVKIGTSKVMRYRPMFSQWTAEFTLVYDETQINISDLKMCFENAGSFIGIGDYRPTFGLFTYEFLET